MHERQFPILGDDHRKLLRSVPWWLVKAHEAQCLKNHDQSVETLASRCGLSLCELAAVLEDRPWRKMPTAEALAAVQAKLHETINQ